MKPLFISIVSLALVGCIDAPSANGGREDGGTTDASSDLGADPADVGAGEDVSRPADAGVLVTVSFQDGVSPTAAYAGTQDTEISANDVDSNSGDNVDIEADELPGILIRWDTSSIPQDATVVDAYVELTSGANGTSDLFDVYIVRRGWRELEATWNQAADTRPWDTPGCQGDQDRAQEPFGALGNDTPFELMTVGRNEAFIAGVADWVRTPTSNHGITIQKYDSDTDGLHVSTSESTTPEYRPRLVVTYEP